MSFKVFSTDDGRDLPIEQLPAGAIIPKVGMALFQSGGNLIVASGTNKPTYISMVEKEAALTAGDTIPVVRVQPDTIWETTNSAAFAAINRGDKVTLSTSGLHVTATTASGVAEVIDFEDTPIDSKVLVRFA